MWCFQQQDVGIHLIWNMFRRLKTLKKDIFAQIKSEKTSLYACETT
jgi:hypothetical protein